MFLIIAGLIVACVIGYVVFSLIKHRKSDKINNVEVDVNVKPNNSERLPIKKALLVGINKYKPELNADLRGCVNDVQDMRKILINTYNFKPENIRVVIDERATKANILSRLAWLINDTKKGDELVFHYSGHGSQVADRNGDEVNDHLDEIMCPHDLNWDDPLTDDILAAIISKLPKGVNLTVISDSCHSGTITRELGNPNNKNKPRYLPPPFDIQSRALDRKLPVNKIAKAPDDANQMHVLLSGCMDNQTSADAYINNRFNGALTWALVDTLKEYPNKTYKEIHEIVLDKLAGGNYSQKPQLSGNKNLINRKIFGGC